MLGAATDALKACVSAWLRRRLGFGTPSDPAPAEQPTAPTPPASAETDPVIDRLYTTVARYRQGEVVEEIGGKVRVFLVPADGVDRAVLGRRLGLRADRHPHWDAPQKQGALPIPELPELLVKFVTAESQE